MSGNLKAWIDDEVDISAVEVAVEVVVPISHVETSAQIEEMEELCAQSGVYIEISSLHRVLPMRQCGVRNCGEGHSVLGDREVVQLL